MHIYDRLQTYKYTLEKLDKGNWYSWQKSEVDDVPKYKLKKNGKALFCTKKKLYNKKRMLNSNSGWYIFSELANKIEEYKKELE